MVQYSPKLIEKTITVFKSRTGMGISQEEARQAVENTSGFFQVLQEWAEAEAMDLWDEGPDDPAGSEEVAQ